MEMGVEEMSAYTGKDKTHKTKFAMIAAALACIGPDLLAGPEIPRKRRDPEPEIYGNRNERRIAKRRAQKQARKRNRKK